MFWVVSNGTNCRTRSAMPKKSAEAAFAVIGYSLGS